MVDGKPEIIELQMDSGASHVMPSVVYYANGSTSVGKDALLHILDDPKHTVAGAKRFVGRPYESLIVQSLLSHFPYKLVPVHSVS